MQLARKKVTRLFGIGLFCLQFTFYSTIFAQTKETVKPIVKKAYQSADVLNRQSLGEIRKKGFEFLQNQNWESASLTFEAALAIAPKDASSLYGKALALFNLKLISEAEARIVAALNAQSQTKENKTLLVDSLVLSAVISAVQNKSGLAIAKLEKAVKLIPKHFDANFSLGRAYFGNGEIEKSILVFRQAVLIQPGNIKAKFFLATALERAGSSQAALKEYKSILKLNPNNVEGNLGLGVLLLKIEGDSSVDGLNALQTAVSLNPNIYEGQIGIGKTLVKLNRAAEAIEHLKKAVELAPNNPEPHFQLAIAYRKLGKKAEANEETEIVKKIHESRRGVTNQSQ